MAISLQTTIFKHLLVAELKIFSTQVKDKIINISIWVAVNLLIFGYIMPAFGLINYGPFELAGLVASAGLFELWPSAMNLVGDFTGDKTISFHLILPLRPWMVLLKILCYYALNACFLALIVIPIGKIILWNQFDLHVISIIQTSLIIILTSFFFSAFTLWMASRAKNISYLSNAWMRIIFPMWFLGGFQFSWQSLYNISPVCAYLNMLNPMNFIMEGTRAALLGPTGFLPFWLSSGLLLLFIIILCFDAYRKLKKRLDFI